MHMRRFITVIFLLMGVVVSSNVAAQSLRSTDERDVDGDGKPDKLVYELKKVEDHYESSLLITSATGKTLWQHEWGMSNDDLSELIQTEGEVTRKKSNLESWVTKFFTGELNYGFRFEKRKLKASEIFDERLEEFAEGYKMSVPSVKKSILDQKLNFLVSYRASWREDLLLLVYVPSIGQFAVYQRGY